MKRLIYALAFVAASSFVVSCNQNSSKTSGHDHNTSTDSTGVLALDNGSKWIVDSTTAHNFVDLKTMTDMFFVNPFPPIGNYQTYGNDMNKGINKMIQECTMKGEGHDMLHIWLEPVIRQTNALKTVSDTVGAKKLFDSVHARIDEYHTYFMEKK